MSLTSSSPFDQRLGTNYAPSDAEKAQIQEIIAEISPEISKLDGEIEALKEALESLEKTKEERSKFLEDHKALLSPIRDLPVDIIHAIFQHCLPDTHNAVLSPARAPLLLTRICRQWRELAINYPPLWSSLHIPIPNVPEPMLYIPGYYTNNHESRVLSEEEQEYFDGEVERWHSRMAQRTQSVSLWLSRAKGSGLSLSIVVGRKRDRHPFGLGRPEPEAVTELISLILGYASQWERFEISAPLNIASRFLSTPASRTPALRSLKVNTPDRIRLGDPPPTNPPSLFTPDGITTAPSLKSVWFESIPLDKALDVPIGWGNLTSFFFAPDDGIPGLPTAGSLTPNSAIEILSRCPNLKRCGLLVGSGSPYLANPQVWGINPPQEDVTPGRRAVLEHLESLTLEQYGTRSLHPFVESLELPALRSLSFAGSTTPCPANPSPLIPLMRNWGHNLKTLTFDYQFLTDPELRECLELAVNVEELSLSLNGRLGRSFHHAGTNNDEDRRPAPARLGNKMMKALTPTYDDDDDDAGSESESESTRSVLCPSLVSFAVRLPTIEFGEDALLAFVRGRRHAKAAEKGIAKISKIKVNFAYDWPQEVPGVPTPESLKGWPLLETIRDDPDVDLEGLDLKVKWSWYDPSVYDRGLERPKSDTTANRVWSPSQGLWNVGAWARLSW
ncbi:hypothetical protein CC2G_008108 [Coprinopsis cinerea AmutBmut pab1-1]|nr:hypothetical protein CC2G_008108 [Coprinopsis cinerea AmutBmut pab1-1]